MAKPTDDELTRRYQTTLDAFVLRARRVVQHSLAADPKLLLDLSQGRMRIELEPAVGKTFLVQDLPEEELVESAAARVRPLLLNSEPVFWSSTLKAMSFLCRNETALNGQVFQTLRETWKKVQPAGEAARAYFVQVQGLEDDAPKSITDHALGLSWFYGDVVHADPKRQEEGDAFGITERYRAAVMLVAVAMVATKATLNVILDLEQRGILRLSDAARTTEVVVPEVKLRREIDAFFGPAGTSLPNGPLGTIPEGFERLRPGNI